MIKRIDIVCLAAVSFSLTTLMSYTNDGQSESLPYFEIKENKIFIHSNNDVFYLVNDENNSFLFENFNDNNIKISFHELVQLLLSNRFENRWFDLYNLKPSLVIKNFIEKTVFIFKHKFSQFISYVYYDLSKSIVSFYKKTNPVRAGPALLY